MDLLRLKQQARGFHPCGGGGGSSSSSQATNQTDNRRVIGANGVSAENSNVNYSIVSTDQGTVAGAFNFATAALGAESAENTQTQKNAVDSLNTSTAAISQAYASARGQGNLTEYVLIGAMALVGIIAYAAVKK